MVKPGVASTLQPAAEGEVDGTRRVLVDAAIDTLREKGFAGTSARAIAQRAGCNQALVFYYFRSVVGLLLAALDDVSRRRQERYTARLAGVTGPRDLVAAAGDIFREDLDAGHAAVLAELIAGASSTPGLGAEVARRLVVWTDFAEQAVGGVVAATPFAGVVPVGDVAYAVVAFYLGVEMLSHLEGDRSRAEALFARASEFAGLLEVLTGTAATNEEEAP